MFGEIVEPSTRALIDETEDYPAYTKPNISINNELLERKFKTILFVDTLKAIKIIQTNVIGAVKPLTIEEINIYCLPNENCVVTCQELKKLTTGEVLELLDSLIRNSTNVYAVTSASISSYLSSSANSSGETIVKCLTTNPSKTQNCEILETPNLITGLGANLLTYCQYLGLDCTLFAVYLDHSPLDSVSSKKLLNVVKNIGFSVNQSNVCIEASPSNLYI